VVVAFAVEAAASEDIVVQRNTDSVHECRFAKAKVEKLSQCKVFNFLL
jgi:hypothetical protein